MNISEQMQRTLQESLQRAPLQEDELRRVEGMGNLYVSLKKMDELGFLYALEIDGVHYYFHRKSR